MATTALIAGCGSSTSGSAGTTVTSPATAAQTTPASTTTIPPTTTTTIPPGPTSDYIAVCDGQATEYLDPGDATTEDTVQWAAQPTEGYDNHPGEGPPPLNFGTFTPSLRDDANDEDTMDCGKWSYNNTLTEITGLDKVDGVNLPATYNLVTGKITDLATSAPSTPDTTASFSASNNHPAPHYIGAYFNPEGQQIWQLAGSPDTDTVDVISPSGSSTTYNYLDDCDYTSVELTFIHGSSTPVVGCPDPNDEGGPNNQAPRWDPLVTQVAYTADTKNGGYVNTDALTTEVQNNTEFGVNFGLPWSNYVYSVIRRSDTGTSAAFVGELNNECTLFIVGINGGSPDGVGALPSCGNPETYQVIRYVP